MTDRNDRLLFSEFSPVSTSAWEEKIREDLKGKDYEKKLIWKTIEGLRIKPYYRKEDLTYLDPSQAVPGVFPYLRGSKKSNNCWQIRQQVLVADPSDANLMALDLIEKGITSLDFVVLKKYGLTQDGTEKLLRKIHLADIEINFSGYHTEASAEMFVRYLQAGGNDNDVCTGSVNYDPLGRLCTKGHFSFDSESLSCEMLTRLIQKTKHLPRFRTVAVNARCFGNAGSSAVQELAFGLAMGAEYLCMLTDQGISVEEAANKMGFHFAVSSGYFLEIAKYRAARFLWSKIISAFDADCKVPMHIHAETARWNLSVYDPYVNLLRTSTEGMSAVLSGVDALTVLPFDITFEKPSVFAERIARNQQIILKEEAYFDKVMDPAAGSYYIESLTASVAEASWNLFLEVQRKGGFVASLKEGFIQEKIKETAQQRDVAIATRKEFSVGTNQYPNFKEIYTEKPRDYSAHCCCTCKDDKCSEGQNCFCEGESCSCDCRGDDCDCSCCNADKRIVQPIRQYRGTWEFEKLRLQTDLGGRRPRVFMLTIGNLSMRHARSQFSCNFFACAGYEVIDNPGFKTVDEGIDAAISEKAEVVVLCSSDEEYTVLAPEVHQKLKDKAILVVAGAPPGMDELKTMGIENFVYARSNVLETLKQYHKKLRI
jgi:methylmalonyl-CoA mutase